LTDSRRSLSVLMLLFSSCFVSLQSAGQRAFTGPASSTVYWELPSAPEPQAFLQSPPAADTSSDAAKRLLPGTDSLPAPGKYDPVIEPGQSATRLSAAEKLVYTVRSNVRVVRIFPALYSAGYEQLAGSDPKYGSDAGAGAVKFGAAMLRQTTTRSFTDGIFAAVFHQDPRYYRVANGRIPTRGLRAAERSIVRRSDNGDDEINFSAIAGHAASAVLTLAYYPEPSRNTRVVLSTFGVSFLTDAGANLVLEFFPDLSRRFPVLKKIQF
jgi:hypothetical protein